VSSHSASRIAVQGCSFLLLFCLTKSPVINAQGAQPARMKAAVPAKDVLIYVDVSDSTATTPSNQAARSFLSLFAQNLSILLSSSSFLRDDDSIRFVWFADRRIDGPTFNRWANSKIQVRDLLQMLKGDQAKALWAGQGLHTNITNLGQIFASIPDKLRADRPAIVIIASDLAHDPNDSPCVDEVARENDFGNYLQNYQTAIDKLDLPVGGPVIALLKGDGAVTPCPSDSRVGAWVEGELKNALSARPVSVVRDGSEVSGKQLLQAVAQPLLIALSGESVLGPDPDRQVAFLFQNVNSFSVTLSAVNFVHNQNVTTDPQDPPVSIAPGESHPVVAHLPVKAGPPDDLEMSGESDYGASRKVRFENGLLVHGVSVYKYTALINKTTAYVIVDAEAKLRGKQRAEMILGDQAKQFFEIDVSSGRRQRKRIAFPIEIEPGNPSVMGERMDVALALSNNNNLFAPDGSVLPADEPLHAAVKSSLFGIGIAVPFGEDSLFLVAVVVGIIFWRIRKSRTAFDQVVHQYHVFTFLNVVLAAAVGFTLRLTDRYGVPDSKAGLYVNVTSLAIIAGILMFWWQRWMVINIQWPLRVEPERHSILAASVARQRRARIGGRVVFVAVVTGLIVAALSSSLFLAFDIMATPISQ
jgi:hypothetical protein